MDASTAWFVSIVVVGTILVTIFAMARSSGRESRDEELERKLADALESEMAGAPEGTRWK
mgnify:CR=1 FL=1